MISSMSQFSLTCHHVKFRNIKFLSWLLQATLPKNAILECVKEAYNFVSAVTCAFSIETKNPRKTQNMGIPSFSWKKDLLQMPYWSVSCNIVFYLRAKN